MMRSRLNHVGKASVLLLAITASCRLFDGASRAGARFIDASFRHVVTAASLSAPDDAGMRLSRTGQIEWRRGYAGQPDHVITGRYQLLGDSLRVSWAQDYWYTLGALDGDTLRVSYQGAGDWAIREFYVRH